MTIHNFYIFSQNQKKKACHPSSKKASPFHNPSRKHPRPRPTPRPPARGALIPHQLHLPMRILLQLHRRTRQQPLLPLLLQLPRVFKQLVLIVLVDIGFDDDVIRIALTATSSAYVSLLCYKKPPGVCVAGRKTEEEGGGRGWCAKLTSSHSHGTRYKSKVSGLRCFRCTLR